MTTPKFTITKCAAAALLVLTGLAGCASEQQPAEAPHVSIVKPSYVTDISDPQKLAGLADDVFVGRVVTLTGSTSTEEALPANQYKVQVVTKIKGSLSGTVTVNQHGGLNAADNELVIIEDDQLISPGNTYLFATRRDLDHGWHTVVPVFGDRRIEGAPDQAAPVVAMKAAAKKPIAFNARG